jgi:SAM-dependent methyltransferase
MKTWVQRFDIVFALDVLEHVKDLDKAIENIYKLLKPYGFLIATVPLRENLTDNMVVCPFCHHVFHRIGHYHSFHSMDDVHRMLGKYFEIIEYDFPSITPEEKFKTLLKKTIFRRKYYKDGFPNFRTTLFFDAQKI